jgi:hypothetical protein
MSDINKDTGSYWDHTGKYQQEYDAAWEALIPASGKAKDGYPEALRAISRIGYDYYNNGFGNLWQSWDDGDIEMDSYYEDLVDYLRSEIPRDMHKQLKEFLWDAKGYGNWSNQAGVIDRIINHIIEQMLEEELITKA